MKKRSTLIGFLIFFATIISYGQAGSLDSDFEADGKVITGFDNLSAEGRSIAVQEDGKIVVAGQLIVNMVFSDFGLVRYNIDGSLDNTFGTGGRVITDFGNDDRAYSLVIQPDGKIIVAGTSNSVTGIESFALARYGSDGTLDASFDTDGIVTGPFGDGRSVALQADGKILVAGTTLDSPTKFMVSRYNNNGTLDTSFDTDGMVTTSVGNESAFANSIAIQSDGKIVVIGYGRTDQDFDFAVVRYNSDGSLDNSFSVDGIVTTAIEDGWTDRAESVVIQEDGKIVVAGRKSKAFSSGEFAIVRYHANGTLDNSFGVLGKVTSDIKKGFKTGGQSVVLQVDGKVVVAGRAAGSQFDVYDFALLRYLPDGTPDNSFGTDGIVKTNFGFGVESSSYGCAIQPDGKIIVAGFTTIIGEGKAFAVTRYLSGLNFGVVDFSIQENSLLIYPNPLKEAAVLEYSLINDETVSIDLYDISGSFVQSFVRSEKRMKGDHRETLNIDTFIPPGTYILTLSNGVGSSSIRIVK